MKILCTLVIIIIFLPSNLLANGGKAKSMIPTFLITPNNVSNLKIDNSRLFIKLNNEFTKKFEVFTRSNLNKKIQVKAEKNLIIKSTAYETIKSGLINSQKLSADTMNNIKAIFSVHLQSNKINRSD